MDVVVERAVDRATASSASCPRSIPSRRAASRDVLARFAMSATPAASTPFCAATNPNATRNPSNPTRKSRVGTRARTPRVRRRSEPGVEQRARLANRSQRDASIIVGAPARRSRLHRARRRTARRRVEARRRPRGRVASDEIGTRRDEVGRTLTRGELNAFQFFASAVERGAEVSRAVREGQLVLALVDVGDVSSFAVERRESRREENRGGVESEVIEPARRPTTRRARPRTHPRRSKSAHRNAARRI